MLRSFFKRGQPRADARSGRNAEPGAASVPTGAVVWAVGDIHGRLDLLEPLLDAILDDLRASAATRKVIVFLGDYIDRGADSRGVLDRLCSLQDQTEIETHFLRGNHEDRMEAFLDDPEVGPGWCEYGGREALRSYGVTSPTMKVASDAWVVTAAEFGQAVPDRHREFLSRQEYSCSIGDYFFAHAGARPGVALAEQSPDDLMWIRQGFLNDRTPFEQIVVHGHTPGETVHADHRRIAIDTGAYATGMLTGLRLEAAARETLNTRLAGPTVRLERRPLA